MTRVRLRPEIERLAAYDAGPQDAPGAFQLAGNENPFEPLPSVLAAVRNAQFSRYPDAHSTALRGALASRFNVRSEEVHVSAGSVSIIYELVRALAGPGDEVMMSWRSFEAYPKAVALAGAISVEVPNTRHGAHNLNAMSKAVTDLTRVILVCSPNNPTGNTISHSALVRFLGSIPANIVVALDEAYIEYVRDVDTVRSIELLRRFPNLVVLRTFSKAYGLAGLRVGYAVGNEKILAGLRTASIPFAASSIAQAAAVVSLAAEKAMTERVEAIVALRTQVVGALRRQGWSIPSAQGNFVWLSTGSFTKAAAEEFRANGMLVREFPDDGVRITIAEKESVLPLLTTAQRVRSLMSIRRATDIQPAATQQ